MIVKCQSKNLSYFLVIGHGKWMPNLWKLSRCLVRFFRSNSAQTLGFYHQILQPEYAITWIFLLSSVAIKKNDRREIWIFCTHSKCDLIWMMMRVKNQEFCCPWSLSSTKRTFMLCEMSPIRNKGSLANIFNRQKVFLTLYCECSRVQKYLQIFSKWNGVFLWQCWNSIDQTKPKLNSYSWCPPFTCKRFSLAYYYWCSFHVAYCLGYLLWLHVPVT